MRRAVCVTLIITTGIMSLFTTDEVSVIKSKNALSLTSFESSPDAASLDMAYERYIKPLSLTTVIGVSWYNPSELDSDAVLTIYMIKLLNENKAKNYYINYEYQLPANEVESYTSKFFGMSAEKTREASGYDHKKQIYTVPQGIGGAWNVQASGITKNNNIISVQYNLLNGQNEISAHGEIAIQINDDDSWRYLYNIVTEKDSQFTKKSKPPKKLWETCLPLVYVS